MANKGTARWAVLVLASLVTHIALLVNSTESALWNEQGREGVLLAQQLAEAVAPLAVSRDMVSLSVLVGRYENRPGIASVRLYDAQGELAAEAGAAGDEGRLFTAPVHLPQQTLGRVELRLAVPPRGLVVRQQLGNIGVAALLHALLFGAGLLLGTRRQAATSAARPAAPAPVPARPLPPAPPGITLLHLALDDPNGLLTRVNASMADELLGVFDQFVDRAARLYGGEVTAPFSPDGVLVRFAQADAAEREFQALAAAALFLRLVEDAAEDRREHGRLCLGAKAGVLHGQDAPATAAVLAHTAPPGRILSSLPQSPLGSRCRLGLAFQLAVGPGETLQAAVLEELAPEYRQLIANQSQQILAPLDAD